MYAGTLRVYAESFHLYAEVLHAYAESLHVYAGSLHVYAGSLHVYAGSLHAYAESLHVYAGSLHAYGEFARVRVPAAAPALTQKLELETRAGAYLFLSKFLLSRIRGVTAPVLSDDREATRVRLRRELGNC